MDRQPDVEALLTKANQPSADALRLHPWYRGKLEVIPKCAIRGLEDFAIWYTPGVAAPCREIAQHPDTVFDHTNKGNTVAIVSDGSRVLGLGDIGPHAALEVVPRQAAVSCTAMAQGVASLTATQEELCTKAAAIITRAREETRVLMEHGLIGATASAQGHQARSPRLRRRRGASLTAPLRLPV